MEGIVPWKAVWRQLQNERLVGNKEEAAFVQKPLWDPPTPGIHPCFSVWSSVLRMRPNLLGFSSLWLSSHIHKGKSTGRELI